MSDNRVFDGYKLKDPDTRLPTDELVKDMSEVMSYLVGLFNGDEEFVSENLARSISKYFDSGFVTPKYIGSLQSRLRDKCKEMDEEIEKAKRKMLMIWVPTFSIVISFAALITTLILIK